MKLSIIIVSFNTSHLLKKCLESIFNSKINNLSFEVIVVDNNSADNSERLVKSHFPQVKLIRQGYNSGFSRANNAGIEKAKGEYLLFLNSDIVLFPNTLQDCFDFITANPDIGVLSCTLVNKGGSIQKFESTIASYRKLLNNNIVLNYLIPVKEFKKEAVMGAFMLIPKEVLTYCGWFDPDFFFYSEEIELINRIRKRKFSVKILEDVYAFHKSSASSPGRTWASRQAYLSQSLLFLKVRSYSGFYLLHLILFFNFLVNFLVMWKLDANYRTGYFYDLKNYFSVFFRLMKIPFLYSRKFGKGKKLLKY